MTVIHLLFAGQKTLPPEKRQFDDSGLPAE